jgi:uncharacterized membrane protein YphA (DoxX/SURF4 family)
MTTPPPPGPRSDPLPWLLAAGLAIVGGAALVAGMMVRAMR